jgi:hypothetical protein
VNFSNYNRSFTSKKQEIVIILCSASTSESSTPAAAIVTDRRQDLEMAQVSMPFGQGIRSTRCQKPISLPALLSILSASANG